MLPLDCETGGGGQGGGRRVDFFHNTPPLMKMMNGYGKVASVGNEVI